MATPILDFAFAPGTALAMVFIIGIAGSPKMQYVVIQNQEVTVGQKKAGRGEAMGGHHWNSEEVAMGLWVAVRGKPRS